ncbi:MAG: M20 family metallo-hydrolase [Hungatella sp.]|nr:M20 family metallo-hydrolase [Hungatella sp.]
MNARIVEYAKELDQISRMRRRDFHRFAETAWLEMRTSAIINKTLTELGYEVVTGRALCLEEARIGVPEAEVLKEHAELALCQGAPEEYLTEDMKEGFTGVMGILECGEGPVVALRFDIDALGLIEEEKESHRPFREGFASVNRGMMHACGHDGHGAIGLGVAEVLMRLKKELCGTIKLIFQPGEEGAKGARAIVAHGHLDDVDYFVGTHIAPTGGPDDGDVTPGTWGSLATSKYDAHFYGEAAHAGGFPERGRNAIAAACNAVVNLTAIPRHSAGITRVNVGVISGGTGRNVVSDHAMIQFEVRGETTEINRFMDDEAVRICKGAALMCGCTCELILQGGAESQHSDEDFLEQIAGIVERDLPHLRVSSCKNAQNWGSEDISLMMNRVQEHGGKAVYMRSMTPMASAQHTVTFDFDEKVLAEGIQVFAAIVWELCKK